MPRLRHSYHLIDLANSKLTPHMMQRLHELTGSSVINLLNVIVICYIDENVGFSFTYEDNVLCRYIGGIKSPIPPLCFDLFGIAWNAVSEIELEDDTLVFYQRSLQE